MKAIVQSAYGSPDILKLEEVEKPTPGDNEVLVRVHAVSLNGSDWEGLRGKPLYARLGGLRKPGNRIPGSDIAGRVEMVGKNVREFQPGEEVFGEMAAYRGGLAEFACTSEKHLARKPASMTFEQAAAIPQGAVIALQGIHGKGNVQRGQMVLINGAGGSAGSFGVQLAKYYGAEVTGVDNTGKLDFLRSLGADHVIDYTREDFTKNGKEYDLILDVIAHRSVFDYARALRPAGNYFAVGGSLITFLQILLLGSWIRRRSGKNVHILAVQRNRKDLDFMAGLYESGKVVPIIDRRYPLDETPEAIRHLGAGQARGKIIITIMPA
jgi:NADPH:quinone reductase-like Zn-dependent oxidoreductase